MTPRLDVSMSDAEIRAFLEPARTAVLSTLAPDGGPHSAGMWYEPRDDSIRMWTYAKSQKARNARRDPRAAVLVEEGVRYSELKGVLVRGRLHLVEDFEEVLAIGVALYNRYTLPVTGIAVDDGPIAEISKQASKRVGLILPLDKVASWDHSRMG